MSHHHLLRGLKSEQTLGDIKGQGSLVPCSPWSCKELDTTEQHNMSPLCNLPFSSNYIQK